MGCVVCMGTDEGLWGNGNLMVGQLEWVVSVVVWWWVTRCVSEYCYGQMNRDFTGRLVEERGDWLGDLGFGSWDWEIARVVCSFSSSSFIASSDNIE